MERVVEQAARKVAAAATAASLPPSNDQKTIMNRNESIAVIAVLILLQFSTLMLSVQVKNRLTSHAAEFRHLCETVAEQNPNTDPVEKAKAISRCSNNQ